jgi:hypothetical protein
VVPGAADGEPIAIHADHINMVKFGSKADGRYKMVSGRLRVMAARAGDAVGRQWDREDRLDTGMQTWTGGYVGNWSKTATITTTCLTSLQQAYRVVHGPVQPGRDVAR